MANALAGVAHRIGAARWIITAAAVVMTLPAARAQDYPSHGVELIVPFAAGGGSDLLARLLGDGLARRFKQPFVVINRPGANTNLGMISVARSKPDGYTLLIASVGLAANPSLYKSLSFDPLNDLAPISLIANSPTLAVVPPSLPVRTLPELIAYAKARPGELNYASYGTGSSSHLAAELFASMTGTRIVHVPYSGGGPAALGAMTNQVQLLFSSILPVLGMLRSGTLKAIAIAADHRSELLPDVPTFGESGLDYRMGAWFGLLAPAATPPAMIETLNGAAVAVLREPAIRGKIAEQGAEVVANSPAQFREFIVDETSRLSAIIRATGIRLD